VKLSVGYSKTQISYFGKL